jgi:acetylornithine deacetylase/succinyl-diaminopimelate desuccinylase-like protein
MDYRRVDEHIHQHLNSTLEELGRLCAQPSVAAQGTGMQECAELVAEMLAARGLKTELVPSGGYPVVVGVRPGRSDRTLLFYNHYDVQPPEPLELWDTPPFLPSLRDGRFYARGVSDDKGHLQCRLAALDAWLALEGELPCAVKFVVEGEEEIGSIHLGGFLKDHAGQLGADGCIWEFGHLSHDGVPILDAGLRGICYVELSVRTGTRDAHSGLGGSIFPNAAWRLIWALTSLKGQDELIRLPGFYDRVNPPTPRDLELLAMLPDEAEFYQRHYGLYRFLKGLKGGPELRREEVFVPTCTVCGVTSGYQGPGSKTVQPARASAKVDFRLGPDQRPEEVLQQLRDHLDAEGFSDVTITYLGGEPPARTDPDHPFIQLVARCAEEVYGMKMLISPMNGGSGPNHAFIEALEVPVATCGIGYPGSNVHAPNENIVLDYFINGARHTARILGEFGAA